MKSFFKGIWSRTEKEPEARQLTHPDNLRVGDFVRINDSFALPAEIRGKAFKVVGITGYQFERNWHAAYSLQGETDEELDLTIEKDGGREHAVFSLSVPASDVGELFNLDEFAGIFDDPAPTRISGHETPDYAGWVSGTYLQEIGGDRGFYYDRDIRASGPSRFEDTAEPFDYFYLQNEQGSHGLEIYVFEGGETEVSLVLLRPLTDVAELWPAAGERS